jgi:hypothetical protein
VANPNGKAILRASFQLFRQDRQMIWLPVMATITAVIAFAVIAGPIALAVGHTGPALILAFACGSVVATSATVIFNVALVFAATDRMEGRAPTVGGSLAKAWQRKGVIFRWAVLSAVVGTAIRLLEERLGLVGRLIGIAGGFAWVVATYLVIPVLAFENVGPIEAVKRSSSILRECFGTIGRSALRFGFIFAALSIGAALVVAVGAAVAASQAVALGVVIAAVGLMLLIGISMYAAAAGMYMRTILYRYATQQQIPDLGVDVGQAFTTR